MTFCRIDTAMVPYVCAFRGRRDSYQVPLALAESNLLDRFITDAYASTRMRRLVGNRFQNRHEPGIPDDQVQCLWGSTTLEHMRHRLGYSPASTYRLLDPSYARAAASCARRHRSNLLLYSPYAYEAFTASYPRHTPHRVLFQYHPHPSKERRVLAADRSRFPLIGDSYLEAELHDNDDHPEANAWRHADSILCASQFTKHTLVEAGCDERKCFVIPYGVEPVAHSSVSHEGDGFRALFVGSGGQRKGLHHLLMAWRQAKLPAGSELILVCRVLDQGVAALIDSTPGVTLIRGVAPEELDLLYRTSTLFVMPSLIEGFGQVFLEALARGCPVLGTPNTGLPDLGGEADSVYLTPPGAVAELAERLEHLARKLIHNSAARRAARETAARFTHEKFRARLIQALTP